MKPAKAGSKLPDEPGKGPSGVTRYQTSIKEWPAEDRPRERLLERGAQSLTDTELLAIILRVGNASTGESAIDHARHLLSRFGGLKGIEEASISELQKVIGIGPAKVAQIKACLRSQSASATTSGKPVSLYAHQKMCFGIFARTSGKRNASFFMSYF
jgi:DNA repair protein RadC